jgi:hypothetical protein
VAGGVGTAEEGAAAGGGAHACCGTSVMLGSYVRPKSTQQLDHVGVHRLVENECLTNRSCSI